MDDLQLEPNYRETLQNIPNVEYDMTYFSNIIEKILFFINIGIVIGAYVYTFKTYDEIQGQIPLQFNPIDYSPEIYTNKEAIFDYPSNCLFSFLSFYILYLFTLFEECDPINIKFLWKKMEWVRTSLAALSTIAEASWIYMEYVAIQLGSSNGYEDGAQEMWIFDAVSSFVIGLLCLAAILFLKSMCSGVGLPTAANSYTNI